ncbi:hypothetical protein IAT38_004779 [Cryptococcus sp. DSM 104549]
MAMPAVHRAQPLERERQLSHPASASSPDNQQDSDNSPKVLARNSACHQCRKRKLKCDAHKPVCGNCARPRVRGANQGAEDEPPAEDCTWDEPKEPSARTRRRREMARRQALEGASGRHSRDGSTGSGDRKKKAKLNELEGRIGAIESQSRSLPGPNDLVAEPTGSHSDSHTHAPEEYTYRHPPFNVSYFSAPVFGKADTHAPDRLHEVTDGPLVEPGQAQAHAAWNAFPLATGGGGQENAAGVDWNVPIDPTLGRLGSPPTDTSPNSISDDSAGLIWPDWPRELPPPATVNHVVRVFFDKVPTLPRMLNKSDLFQSLQCSPSNIRFPAVCLIHAILALTANYLSESSLSTRAYFPVGTPVTSMKHPEHDFDLCSDEGRGGIAASFHCNSAVRCSATPMARFQLWHRRKSFETFYRYVDRGDKFLQCLQAQVIASTVDQYNAWWTDLWIEAGNCVRISTPMRINESPNCPESSLRRYSSLLLPPSESPLEQAERDRVWWCVYVLEKSVTATTTWPSSLSDDEITVELPVLQSSFDRGFGDLTGVQTLQSPDLLTHHPPRHLDSFCFLIKSLKILSDISIFFRRYSRGKHSVAGYVHNPSFRMLLSQVNSFRMSFPPEFRRPTQPLQGLVGGSESLDRDLLAALWITHSAIMGLGEPLITKDTWMDEGARMTLSAIRASLSLLYDVTATSYDLSLFPPHCSFVWCLSSRGLIRFMGTAIQSGDLVSAAVFRSEIEVFRQALRRYGERFPIGYRHLKVVDDLIAEQESGEGDISFSLRYENCTRDQLLGSARSVGNAASVTEISSNIPTPENVQTFPQAQYPVDSGIGSSAGGSIADGHAPGSSGSNMPPPGPTPKFGAAMGGVDETTQSPAFMGANMQGQGGWDISSFSFDVNDVANLFDGSDAMFDGAQFALPNLM